MQQNRTLSAITFALLLILRVLLLAGCGGASSQSSANQPVTSGLNPVPAIDSLFPSCAPAGEQFVTSANNQLQVVGANFVASSVVRWNGNDRPTTLANSLGNLLTAQLSASDIAAAGTATVTVFNPPPGGGSSNSTTFTATTGAGSPVSIALDSAGKFAYVATAGCDGLGYVSEYTINPTTGALTPIGSVASTQDSNAESVTVDPFGKFVYVANSGDGFVSDGSVAMFTINPTTGALASIGKISGNCPGLCVPLSVGLDPSGQFAYVPNGDGLVPNNIAVYTINPTSGALTATQGIVVAGFPRSVALDPTGKFAYVPTWSASPGSAGNVSMYMINATTGALTSIGTITAGIWPFSVAIDPTGKFAYASNSGSDDVSMFTIDTATGGLTSIGTITVGGGSIAVHPSGKFVYVSNLAGSFSTYSVNATSGTLTLIGTTGAAGSSIAIHPSGEFAYVTNLGSNSVSMYNIDAVTGTFTLIGTIGT